MNRRRIFVTGGTGFVGGALLARLVDGPDIVVALARDRTKGELVAAAGAEPVIGDLSEADVLRSGMEGCDLTFHVAGVNQMCVRNPDPMYRANVDGTRAVVEAAAAAGVRRVVVTSSAAAIGEPSGTVGDESTEHRGRYLSHYERSKHEGEQEAFAAGQRFGVEVVAVNPSSVQGPGRSGGSTRLLRMVLGAPFAVVAETTLSIVDIEDCTEGHLAAAEHGAPGERYILNGASLPVRRALDVLRALSGRRIPAVVLPAGPARAILAPIAALAGRREDAVLCPEMLRGLLHGHRYDGNRAVRELGIVYRPVEDTLERTIRWLVDFGFIRRDLPGFARLPR